MNDEPKSIWSRPWKGRAKVLGWLAILTAAVFLFVFGYRLGFEGNGSIPKLILYSLLFSVIISALVAVAVLFVRWLCCWRNLRRILFGVACAITLVALFYAEENWRGKRAWEAHKRQWEAKGEKFTLVQLAPPPVPDEQNFAMTPLLKAAMDCSGGNEGMVGRDTNGVARLERLSAELSDGRRTNDSLVLGNLEKGTFADLAVCREFYRGNKNYPQPATPGPVAADIVFALGKYDPEIKELREAAATRPNSRFAIEYDHEPSWTILLPHLAKVKQICKLTQARAVARLELGQSREAFEELMPGLRLSDSIRDEPLLIDHLVRIATLNLNLQVLREGLLRHAWSDVQLAELEKYLASLNLLAEYKLAMRGERACNTSGLDWLRRQKYIHLVGESFLDAFAEGRGPGSKYLNLMPSGWYYQNMLTISRMHQEFTLPSVDEKAHRVLPEFSGRLDEALMTMIQKRYQPYKIFAAMLFPAVNGATRKSARMQTFVDAARVACALERYRLTEGKLPETLDTLVPRFIESVPTDVIDGKPLRYRLKPDAGYVLYSVGWNKTDDGGEIAWIEGKKMIVDITKGDWVWQMPGK